jgi:hypothetical protein
MAKNEQLVKFSENEASRLIQLYNDAESEILREINRALMKGKNAQYLQTMLRNVRAILEDLRSGSRQWCEEAIPDVYSKAMDAVNTALKAEGLPVAAGFGAIHQHAVHVLAESAFNRFDDVARFIGRRVDDIYRHMALQALRGSVVGYETWKQAADKYMEQLADKGITGFKDAAERQWNMKTYAEMVARTTTMEAHLEGTRNRLVENGKDLVKVSTHSHPCPKCQRWEGKVLSLSGKTKGYPTLDDAKSDGLFHPNCEHAYGLFLPGFSE